MFSLYRSHLLFLFYPVNFLSRPRAMTSGISIFINYYDEIISNDILIQFVDKLIIKKYLIISSYRNPQFEFSSGNLKFNV